MSWNMATYLPEAGNIQTNFNTIIVGYIATVNNYLQEELERIAPGSTPVRKRKSSLSQTPRRSQQPRSGSGDPGSVDQLCADLVDGELSQKLFGVVEKINKKLPEITGTDPDQVSVFPELPGSHLRYPRRKLIENFVPIL